MEREERYLNVAAYKFVALSLERQEQVRLLLKAWCKENNLKGTIYIAAEGFNCFLAGREEDLRRFQRAVADSLPEAEGLEYKESWAAILPFERLTVRKKKEIIALGVEDLTLPFFEEQAGDKEEVAPHLPPEEFAKWLKEGKDMLILDTRNTYETRVGTFANSITLDIETFRDFPSAMQRFIEEQNCKNNKTTPTTKEKQEIEPKAEEKGETAESKDVREKPVVMFCTGGVRCEKAGPLLQKKMGFKQVYQLDGGILKYFEKIGGDFYEGDCYVFDKRLALTPQLAPREDLAQCQTCRNPLTSKDRQSPLYKPPHCCPYCPPGSSSSPSPSHSPSCSCSSCSCSCSSSSPSSSQVE